MRKPGLLLTVALLLNLVISFPNAAANPAVMKTSGLQGSIAKADGILIPYQPQNSQISTQDKRIPLILVHGIDGEQGKYYYWNHFLKVSQKNPEFQNRFKIYLFRYNSSQSVPVLSQQFRQTLKNFIQETSGPNLRILAYSEGGLLARDALMDPELSPHIEKVITIATPFHGSPLANPDWVRQEMKQKAPFSLIRMTHRILYRIAHHRFPAFQEDFGWDNFDGALPEVRNGPPVGSNQVLAMSGAVDQKLVTYGSYFGVGVDPDQQLATNLEVKEPLPQEHHAFRNPGSVHFLFLMVRRHISKMPLAYPTSEKNKPLSRERLPLMTYNDGISPISSTLWLGRNTPHRNYGKNASACLWDALKALRGTPRARLFAGLDHRDWMDGKTRMSTKQMRDLLHPEEPPKTTFEWFMSDLMADIPA